MGAEKKNILGRKDVPRKILEHSKTYALSALVCADTNVGRVNNNLRSTFNGQIDLFIKHAKNILGLKCHYKFSSTSSSSVSLLLAARRCMITS